jgi:lysophospholipase L1-like esterase
LITIGIGINDVGLQLPDAFAFNLEEIVVPLQKLGAPVAIANIPDLALAPAAARLGYEQWAERMYPTMEALLRQEASAR